MEFHKFYSIENAYQKTFLNKIRTHPCAEKEWVVLEKIHGANFSFTTDGKEIKVSKRTSFLSSKELQSFYKCQDVVEKYQSRILDIFNLLNDVKEITVFGELFGGSYPEYKSNGPAIQKGIHYCPFYEFYAFDIYVDGKYLNYDAAIKLFDAVKLIYAHVLFRGSLSDTLQWSEEHKSDVTTIPVYFGLPSIIDNHGEGHVLKPVEPAQFFNNSAIVIKNKNPKFAEKKFRSVVVKPTPLSLELQNSINTALLYVTVQRYNNVVSKIGTVTKKDVGRLIGLLSKDALEDYNKDVVSKLEKTQLGILNRQVNKKARKIVLAELDDFCTSVIPEN